MCPPRIANEAAQVRRHEALGGLDQLRFIELTQLFRQGFRVIANDVGALLGVRQFHMQPNFDTTRTDDRRRHVGDVHRGHDDAYIADGFAFETVKLGEKLASEARILAILEDDIRVVDEEHRRRGRLGGRQQGVLRYPG